MKNRQIFTLSNRRSDEIIAFCGTGAIRIDQFLAEARAVSRQLPDHQYVINLFADRYQYLLGFCAAVIARQCTLMPPNRLSTTLSQLVEAFPDSYILGDAVPGNSELSPQNLIGVSPGEICADAPKIPADQLCAILFTSGSTGTPTPNLKYWETLRTGSLGNAAMLLEKKKGRLNLLATVPPQHMWGFETSILLPLFADATVSHLTPFYPQDIADALESLPKPRALISSPVHLAALLKSGVQLVKLDRIFSSTAPLPRQLAKELESRFNTRVLEIFGCSETGVMATRNTANETLWQLSDLFKLESIKDGILIRGQHLPEEIVLPDSIELTSDHRFRWLGRHQDMINIVGKRGSLTDLNHRLLAIHGVVDGVMFLPDSSSERLAAMVVAPNLNPADILGALKSQIEPVFLPRPVYMISDLPRQETGKLAKNVVLELFEKTRRARMPDYEQPMGQASTSDRDKTN